MGLKTCINLSLTQIEYKVNNNCPSKLNTFLNKKVFEGIGTFSVIKIKLPERVVPIANPLCRVPIIIKSRLEETLKLLCDKGIIQPVNEPLEWVKTL